MKCQIITSALLFLLVTPARPMQLEVGGQCESGVSAAKESGKVISDLAVKLHREIGKADENSVFSPVSIALALALLEAGAQGATRNEILKLIGSKQYEDSGRLYQSLQRQLQIQSDKARLDIANGFFPSEKLRVNTAYVDNIRKCFGTAVIQEPFQTKPETARLHINQWVANRTANKIPELLKPKSIDQNTMAVLANAVYLKAAWLNLLSDDGENVFYRLGKENQEQKVKFMSLSEGPFPYYAADNFEVLELPYDGVPLSMFIILPKKLDGIGAVEKSLRGDQLVSIFGKVKPQPHGVTLLMPKFTIRQSVDLNPILEKLGLQHVFSDPTDFSRMSPDRLKVSKVSHEAFIKVYENGTEAAAATEEDMMVGMSLEALPVPFTVNHPFIYAIVHKPTSAIVFMGRVNSIDNQE